MAIMQKKRRNDDDNGNIFWVTMSDLMLGLAIIFITLFVLAMTGFNQKSVQQQRVKMEVAKKIENELQSNNINAKIDKLTGDLEIPSSTLFEVNSYILKPEGKKFLDRLTPIYVNTIFSNKKLVDNIDSIIIQGHTDSQAFAGLTNINDQFTYNMDLSTKRANAVADYMLRGKYKPEFNEGFRHMITVEGRSFNDLILDENGNEDMAKSRRVEIKLKVADWSIATFFGLKH
ncbi:OmpA family protein [bacterium]|nr:OmpA family protein [bacterium]MBP3846366.1 OmpA family protein [bacterium]